MTEQNLEVAVLEGVGSTGEGAPSETTAGRADIARGGLWGAGGWLVSTAVGAGLTIALVRVMSPRQYGGYSFAFAATGLLSALAGLGLNLAVAQIGAAERAHRGDSALRETGDLSLRLAVISALVSSLLGVLLALLAPQLDAGLRPARGALFAMLPVVTLSPVLAACSGMLRVTFRAKAIVVSVVISSVLQGILVVAAVLAHLISATDIAATRGIATCAAAAVLVVAVSKWRASVTPGDRAPGLWRKMLSFSVAMLLTAVFTTMVSQLDVFVLGVDRGSRETAIYQPLSRLSDLLLGLPILLGNYFLPASAAAAARKEHEKVRRLYHWASRWNLVLCAPALAVGLVAAKPVVVVLFGARYGHVADALQVLALGAAVQVLFGFNGLVLDSYGLARLVAIRQVIALAVSVAACVLLIPRLGALGAAAATSVAIACSNVMCSGVLRVRYHVAPWDRALTFTAAAFAAGLGAAFLLDTAIGPDYGRILLTGAVVGAATLVGSSLAAPAEERRDLFRRPRALLMRASRT